MIIKVQTSTHQDRFLIEAVFIEWETRTLLNIYIASKALGDAFTSIEDEPSKTLVLEHGDIVYIMNNEGKTIDSKHIVLGKESKKPMTQSEVNEAIQNIVIVDKLSEIRL